MGLVKDLREEYMEEAISVSKVDSEMSKYESALEKLLKNVKKYRNGKFERRLEKDYAGDEKALEKIGKQLVKSTKQLEDSFKDIKKVVG